MFNLTARLPLVFPPGGNDNKKQATCDIQHRWNCGSPSLRKRGNIILHHSPPPTPTTTTIVSQSFVVNGHLTSQERRVSRACAEARFAANAEAASQVISFGPCLTVAAPEAVHHPGDNEGMRDAKSGLCRGFHSCDVRRRGFGRCWV